MKFAVILAAAMSVGVSRLQQGAPARDAAVTPTLGTASLSGVVLTDEDPPRPVRRAIVSLSGSDLRPSRSAITDDDGRFVVTGLPAGRFTLTAMRASFVTSVYGAKRPGRPGTPIVVAAGQTVGPLAVRLWRGAVIAGILRDETGNPVEGVTVTAIPARAATGRTILTLSGNGGQTNELGEFRIFGLEPGAYAVSASPAAGSGGPMTASTETDLDAIFDALRRRTVPTAASPASRAFPQSTAKTFTYAPIYYPGTPVLAQAGSITLAAGQEQTGLDFSLQRVPTVMVEGTVTRPDGQPGVGASIQLTAVVGAGPFASGPPLVLNTTALADGSFRLFQVTPGDYQMLARAPISGNTAPDPHSNWVVPLSSRPSVWATADVSVGGDDLTGISLALEPGIRITGKLVFDSETQTPPADQTKFRVSLTLPALLNLKPGTPIDTLAFSPDPNLKADGTFEIAGLAPGMYRFLVCSPAGSMSWWPRSAMMGDRDLLDGLVDVTRNLHTSPVVVVLSDRHTELSGMLQTAAGTPASDVFVIAFAEDRKFWGPAARRIQAVRPAVDGRFSLKDLPAGSYLLAAVTDVDQDEWQDPAFLDRLVPASVRVSIAEGEKKLQNLRLGGGL